MIKNVFVPYLIFCQYQQHQSGVWKIIQQLSSMLEIQTPNQKQIKTVPKTKKKSFKIVSKSKFDLRLPSREFNNPIYDGLNIQQENTQASPLGPWTTGDGRQMKHSYSLNSKLNGGVLPKRNEIQYDLRNYNIQKISLIERTPSRSELPTIKQKSKLVLQNLKFGSSDLKRQNLIQYSTEKKAKPKLNIYKKSPDYIRKDLQNYPKRSKIGTVVYNYCTNFNNEQSLFNYKRKGDEFHQQSSEKQQEIKTKLVGLQTYWKSRRSSSTGRFSEIFTKNH